MNTEVPAYLQKYKKEAEVQGQSLADSSTSVPRISMKGKKFKLLVGGEELEAPSLTLDVVILDAQPEGRNFIKTFYEGAFNSKDTAPPDCSSSTGISPDAWVSTPQSKHCATCPKNAFGSATSASGKKAKACRDSKRLYVVRPNDVEGNVFVLNVPVTSLKNLAEYGRKLIGESLPLFAVITTLSFDDGEDYPILCMDTSGFLSEDDAGASYARIGKHEWRSNAKALPSPEGSMPKPIEDTFDSVVAEVVESKPGEGTGSVDDVAGEW